jgi:hypothetical protein
VDEDRRECQTTCTNEMTLPGVRDTDGTGGELIVFGTAVAVDDADLRDRAVAAASYEPAERYVLFELLVAEVRSNGYGNTTLPATRRWRST